MDAIVTASTPAITAAKEATSSIPIVFASAGDPVAAGLVASLAKPGGNVTGITILSPELSGKRLELLKEVIRRLSRVAVLTNPSTPAQATLGEFDDAARAMGLTLTILKAQRPVNSRMHFPRSSKSSLARLLSFLMLFLHLNGFVLSSLPRGIV